MRERDVAGSLEVRRERILARLERVRPKIVVLVAPAGFGKSTVAGQYLEGQESTGICDCGGSEATLNSAAGS